MILHVTGLSPFISFFCNLKEDYVTQNVDGNGFIVDVTVLLIVHLGCRKEFLERGGGKF